VKLRFLFLLLLISTEFASADTYIVGAQNIEYYPHYDFAASNDKGLGWAVLQAFSEHSGHTFVYLSMPVRRLQMEMQKGNVDFVYPDSPRWYNQITKAEEKIFSETIAETLSVTFVKPPSVGKGFDSVKRLAVPFGFTPVEWQQRIDDNLTEITSVEDVYTGFSLLNTGRIDAIDIEYHVGQAVLERNPALGEFVIDVTLPHNIVNFRLSTIHHNTLINELNIFLSENTALIDALKKQYRIDDGTQIIESYRSQQGVRKEDIWSSL
jgi:hypothetical protein